MQLGALLEELTVAKARAGISRLVHLALDSPGHPWDAETGHSLLRWCRWGICCGCCPGDHSGGQGDHGRADGGQSGSDDREVPAGG